MLEKRPFRTPESISAEEVTRAAVVGLLERHGFTDINDRQTRHGTAVSQVVTARTGSGQRVTMHVRLCWRRNGRTPREKTYSAAQLRARLVDGSWERTLDFIATQELKDGNSHNLIVQFEGEDFVHGALIPSEQVGAIWRAQRAASDRLIAAGKMGRIRKNHAANGSSPTLWLQDDRTPYAHEVSDILWSWPGVVNVLALSRIRDSSAIIDDTFDDLPIDYGIVGRDTGGRVERMVSGYSRDPKVRADVLHRAGGACEREGCREQRAYAGFLDVHHILGVAASDRAWTCVALCPNCHREAHCAPDRDAINLSLAAFASRYAPVENAYHQSQETIVAEHAG